MVKCKTFLGSFFGDRVDAHMNEWFSSHPNVKIIKMGYQHLDNYQHSVCIIYEEEAETE